jgi:4-amino-4-deoxy-L-arabinose transferase-like glycosyltransferase
MRDSSEPQAGDSATAEHAALARIASDAAGRRGLWIGLALFAVAFCARLLFIFLFVDPGAPLHDDAGQYDFIGWSVARGGDYVAQDGFRSHRAPGQSLLLAAIYRVCGHDLAAARVVQAALGAGTGLFVLGMGSRLFGPQVGMLAALVWAVFPYSLFFCGTLLSEPLCAFLTAASAWALARAREGVRWSSAWALFAALAALTRPNMGLMFALGALWLATARGRRAGPVLGSLAVFCLTLLPWTVRNYEVHGRFVPVTTMGGVVLWEGNNPYVLDDPALQGRAAHAPDLPEARLTQGLSEVETDAADFHLAIDFLRSHPGTIPRLALEKFSNLWNPFPQVESRIQRWGAAVTVPLMVIFLIVGLARMAKARMTDGVPVILPIATVCATTLIYWGDARIRAPADPEIVLVCSWGAWSFASWLRSRRERTVA